MTRPGREGPNLFALVVGCIVGGIILFGFVGVIGAAAVLK